jgi:multiple sugar transport system substrate-binding protein
MKQNTQLVATLAAFGLLTALSVGQAQQKTSITYWQYQFDSKVAIMTDIIKDFQQQNPDIEVKQETFPFDSYEAKVFTSLAAGQGPDVVNLFYGWLPKWVDQNILKPLPTDAFPAKALEDSVGSLMKASKVDGKYWAVPTAVRTLAVFYNKDLFKQAGITKLPKTWSQLAEIGKKIQKTEGGKVTVAGLALQPNGQDHHLFREVLSRQWGGKPYTGDFRGISYDSAAGLEAFKWYTGLVAQNAGTFADDLFPGSANAYRDAFLAGRAGMIIDGSFAIGTIRRATFNWGVFELPTKEIGGLKSNFGSYWVHGLTKNATGAKLDASIKFMKYLTSEKVQRDWLLRVGEIPASTRLASDPLLRKDPIYGPFVSSLPFAHATFFVDEIGQRKALVDAFKSVWLTKTDPAKALSEASKGEQKLIDGYFKRNP